MLTGLSGVIVKRMIPDLGRDHDLLDWGVSILSPEMAESVSDRFCFLNLIDCDVSSLSEDDARCTIIGFPEKRSKAGHFGVESQSVTVSLNLASEPAYVASGHSQRHHVVCELDLRRCIDDETGRRVTPIPVVSAAARWRRASSAGSS